MKPVHVLLLALGLAGLAIGIPVAFARGPVAPAWTLALPLGVILLGVFFIAWVMRHEEAKYDEEQRLRSESAEREKPRARPARDSKTDARLVSSHGPDTASARVH